MPETGEPDGTTGVDWSTQLQGIPMPSFLRRLIFHYGIYRRYPLRPLPALRNAWRIARA